MECTYHDILHILVWRPVFQWSLCSTRRRCVSEERADSWCKHKLRPTQSPEKEKKQTSTETRWDASTAGPATHMGSSYRLRTKSRRSMGIFLHPVCVTYSLNENTKRHHSGPSPPLTNFNDANKRLTKDFTYTRKLFQRQMLGNLEVL